MEKYCIDRFEGDFAVCENESKNICNFDLNIFYHGAKEGDWFELVDKKAVFLKKLTDEKRNSNLKLLNELMN